MTGRLREAARDALQVMEQCGYLEQRWEAEQLRAALAEQEAEPVAIVVDAYDAPGLQWLCEHPPRRGDRLYTHPPRRELVGLTDDEIATINKEAARGSAIRRDGTTSRRIARAIESALKEKNHD